MGRKGTIYASRETVMADTRVAGVPEREKKKDDRFLFKYLAGNLLTIARGKKILKSIINFIFEFGTGLRVL